MQARIDKLCDMVAEKTMTIQKLSAFLEEDKADFDKPHSLYGIRMIECAANSGNPAILQRLLHFYRTEITHARNECNLMEWASENSDKKVLEYLLSEEMKIWDHYHDDTSDVHADAMAGRLAALKNKLSTAPQRLNETNQNNRTPLFWAGLMGEKEVITHLRESGALKLPEQPTAKDLQAQASNYQGLAQFHKKMKNYPKSLAKLKKSIGYYTAALEKFSADTSLDDYDLLYRNKAGAESERGYLYHFLGKHAEKNQQIISVTYFEQAIVSFQAALFTLDKISENNRTLRLNREVQIIKTSFEQAQNALPKAGNQQTIIATLNSIAKQQGFEVLAVPKPEFNLNDIFWDIAGNAESSVKAIDEFVKNNNIDVNVPHTRWLTHPLELAAQQGNREVTQFLIETLKANMDASKSDCNLFEWAKKNPTVLKYLCSPELKLWERFNDGTRDIHALIAADINGEHLEQIQEKIRQDPTLLSIKTLNGKTLCDYALLFSRFSILASLKNMETDSLNTQFKALEQKEDWYQMGMIYLNKAQNSPMRAQGGYDVKKDRAKFDEAISDLKNSVTYFQRSLPQALAEDKFTLQLRDLISSQTFLAEIYSKFYQTEMKDGYSDSALTTAQIVLGFYNDSLENCEMIPESQLTDSDTTKKTDISEKIIATQCDMKHLHETIGQDALEVENWELAYHAYKKALSLTQEILAQAKLISLDNLAFPEGENLEKIIMELPEIQTKVDFVRDLLGLPAEHPENKTHSPGKSPGLRYQPTLFSATSNQTSELENTAARSSPQPF